MSRPLADRLADQGIHTRVADERVVHRAQGVLMAEYWRTDYSEAQADQQEWWKWWDTNARVCLEVAAKDIIGWSDEIAQQCGLPAGLRDERVLIAGNGPNIAGTHIVFRIEHVMGYLEAQSLEQQR